MPRPEHVIVLKAPTRLLNPAFDAAVIATEEAADPDNAAAEYLAEWRKSGAGLVWGTTLDAVIEPGVAERAPVPPLGYVATVDLASGLGTGKDSAALCIGHEEEGAVFIQDVLREWAPPFDAPAVVGEIARECARFGITAAVGDGFSKGFVAPEFHRLGITYVDTPKDTSECYVLALAVLNSGRARLLDHPKARRQWLGLQRAYGSGGRVKVDHRAGAHDDLADVTAKAIVVALGLGEEIKKKRMIRVGRVV